MGYENVDQLISDNIDYVIDRICHYLRISHVKAPLLFEMLFSKTNEMPDLLAMVAEPTQLALRGISIASRQDNPEFTVPFTQALLAISKFLKKESFSIYQDTTHFYNQIKIRIKNIIENEKSGNKKFN